MSIIPNTIHDIRRLAECSRCTMYVEAHDARSQCAGDCALCDDICCKIDNGISLVASCQSECEVVAVDYSALSRNVDRASARKHFAAGAEWMRNELTRWRDPKEQLPADGQEVLAVVNRQYNTYSILQHDTYGWWQYVPLNGGGWCGYDGDIIGWRPINV